MEFLSRIFLSVIVMSAFPTNARAESMTPSQNQGRLDGSRDVYLRLADATREAHGWGTPRDRASVTGAPLRIGSVRFRRGVGTHAPAELVFPAGGKYRWLTFHAGISEEMTAAGSVTAQVWLDGKKVHETPVMRVKEEPVYVSLPLQRAEEIRIVGTDAGDGVGADHLCLGNLRLCTAQQEPPPDTPQPSRPPVVRPADNLTGKLPQRGATTTTPATRWEECMLTGNGRMGAMVFGRTYDETVVINHCKLYLPQGSREIVHDLADSMPAFKEAGLEAGKDGPRVVHQMMREKTGQKIVNTDPFHPAFMLRIAMSETSPEAMDYVTTENFETGEVVTRWTDERGDWARRLFVSRPDNAAVMSVSGPKGKVGCEVSLEIGHPLVQPEISAADGWISAHAVYAKGKGGYDSLVRVIASGGETQVVDDALSVTGADHVLLLMEVDTWRTPLPREQSEAWAFSPEHPDFGPGHTTNHLPRMKEHLAGLPSDYDALLGAHAKVHGELFSRVSLDLGGSTDRSASSEVLLARAAEEGRASPALMERLYDACRYLIICSTGERPSNLQGIWTGTWSPAWSGDYTLDSNIQLEIQSLMSCHLPELMESYFRLVESWMPDCRLNARKFYGCRGAVSNARASNVCLLLHWGRWPGEQLISCLGWMAHFFYDYTQFTGDREFLEKRAVPLMKDVALFYEDLLAGTEDENGKYRFFIGYSPEHGLSANTTFDIGVAKAVLTYLIKSCEALGIEKENVTSWKAMLAKMPPYLVNAQGGLQEWSWPGVGENFNQRHHSHFLPLYQFCEFDRDRDPQLWKANEIAFQGEVDGWLHREKGSNSNHITHGMMNQGQCAARLGRSDIVHEVLSRMTTKKYVYPSFMISYWPGRRGFGFDPVGTIPDVFNNSLVFCWEGILDIIPALPKEWPTGSISGVLARGQIKIDKLAWDVPAGQIDLSLTSGVKQTITLRLPRSSKIESGEVISGRARLTAVPGGPDRRTLSLPAEQPCRVRMTFSDTAARPAPRKTLPVAGGDVFTVEGHTAFLVLPKRRAPNAPIPWVWYAPTLKGLPGQAETWMFEQWLAKGIAIAGVDVGESFGSPAGRRVFSALYRELVDNRGLAQRACLLARSRGGLMLYNWAVENPGAVACIAGIYPVCNLSSYPGLKRACGAYGMTEQQLAARLADHNPVARLAPLAKAGVPVFHIHGDSDKVVPLDANSGAVKAEYDRLGGPMTLEVVEGQGHNMWKGWFTSQNLVDFVIENAKE